MKKSPFEFHVSVSFGARTKVDFDYATQRQQHEARDQFLRHPGVDRVLCWEDQPALRQSA